MQMLATVDVCWGSFPTGESQVVTDGPSAGGNMVGYNMGLDPQISNDTSRCFVKLMNGLGRCRDREMKNVGGCGV
jgi:hypothetical protein